MIVFFFFLIMVRIARSMDMDRTSTRDAHEQNGLFSPGDLLQRETTPL
jgi:hypothetical protein